MKLAPILLLLCLLSAAALSASDGDDLLPSELNGWHRDSHRQVSAIGSIDEKILKSTTGRQKVAEGLYAGVSQYMENLNSLAMLPNGQKSAANPK